MAIFRFKSGVTLNSLADGASVLKAPSAIRIILVACEFPSELVLIYPSPTARKGEANATSAL